MLRPSFPIRRVILIGLILIVVIPVALFAIWRWRLAQDVNSHLAALRKAGLPTSGTELNDFYPAVSDSENAALVMMKAFELAERQ